MNPMGGYDIEDLSVGMTVAVSRTLTDRDIELFAAVSGDTNPIHLDEQFARTTPFGGRIAHGMLSGSWISAAIACHLPGPGTVYLSQNLRFRHPVRPGVRVDTTITVSEVVGVRRRAVLTTICSADGRTVIEGDAVVLVTSSEARQAGTVIASEVAS